MGYREWAPPAALRGSVVCLWSRAGSPASSEALVLPDGCVDLIWEQGRGAFLAGPDTGPMPATIQAGKTILGVRLRPAAGGPLLGMPLDPLRNLRVDLRDVRPEAARRLPCDLPPDEAMRRLVAITGGFTEDRPPDPAMLAAARLLDDPYTQVHELSARLEMGDRQLRRRFTAAVGYGPKTLHRVLRFRRFLRLLDSAGGLAEFAVRAGYVDQAHLSRETVALAGLPPAALARTVRTPSTR
ncbi:AraC family transcriptional regulator [Actinoplanes sp. NPDC049802]|uniref:AraC family transcriptional regulator n=1 Tax=Actinoplanes sp. NPDC049802 TaxID=3154742 RepID=UPI00340A21AC